MEKKIYRGLSVTKPRVLFDPGTKQYQEKKILLAHSVSNYSHPPPWEQLKKMINKPQLLD